MQLPDPVADKAYELEMPVFTNGRFTRSSMAVLRRSMLELGLVTTVPPDDVLYTERFLPQVQCLARQRHSLALAIRAPSTRASSFAQAIWGWTRPRKPQSVAAITFARPTRLA